jgi:hypothetical protein
MNTQDAVFKIFLCIPGAQESIAVTRQMVEGMYD